MLLLRVSARIAVVASTIHVGAMVLTACSSSQRIATPAARDDSAVQTDSLSYHLKRLSSGYRAYVRATFTNRSAFPVYFARCNPQSKSPMFSLRRTGPDSVVIHFSGFARACGGGVPTGEITVGASVTVRVPVGIVEQPAVQPPVKSEDLMGLMRVELSLCSRYSADSDYCDPLPQIERSSNAFYVSY